MKIRLFVKLLAFLAVPCFVAQPLDGATPKTGGPTAKATFAGGCFWCMEQPFDELDGVLSTVAGYTDGSQYRSGIFYHDEKQRSAAEKSKQTVRGRFKQPVVTEIARARQLP